MRRVKTGVKTLAKDIVLKGYYPRVYTRLAKKSVQKKIVFLEVRRDTLTDDFKPVYHRLKNAGQWKLAVCCLQEGMADRRTVHKNCMKAIREIASAAIVLTDDTSYLLGSLPLRAQTKVIQLWHACGAFKKWGYSVAEMGYGHGTKELEKYGLYRNIDKVTVSSPEVVWAYAEAFGMKERPQDVVACGVARTDYFFSRKYIHRAIDRVRSIFPQAVGGETGSKKIILYAPTFRGQSGNAAAPDFLDLHRMQEVLGQKWIVLIKHHPFVKKRPPIPEECAGFAFDVTDTLSITDLLMTADLCISDYSSLIFEYSLLKRPMIMLAPDLDEYYDERGFYYPYRDLVPGPVAQDTEDVIRMILCPEEYQDEERMADFRIRYMGACDGHAAERIVDLIEKLAAENVRDCYG